MSGVGEGSAGKRAGRRPASARPSTPGPGPEGPTGPLTERRRSPRALLQSEETIRLELRHRVHLLDISQSGALMACETRLPVGTRAIVRTELAGLPFSADAVVKRLHGKGRSGADVVLSMQFGTMDERSRQNLEQFLRRGKD